MAKLTIQQARDRAEVLWGAKRPEWVDFSRSDANDWMATSDPTESLINV